MINRFDRILILLLMLGLLAAGYLAVGRVRMERANRTVEVIVDADDVRAFALASGLTGEQAVDKLREAGVSALAVHELTLGDLVKTGRVFLDATESDTIIMAPDATTATMVGTGLQRRLPKVPVQIGRPARTITLFAPSDRLLDVPVMLRPEDVVLARTAGLRLVARPRNYPGATAESVEAALGSARQAGASLVIFDKEEVLGFDGLIAATAASLQQHDLQFGFVEMAAQRGDAALAKKLAGRIVRVHSITEADMLTMTPAVAVPRYARAVQERGIRAVYLRLLTRPQTDPLTTNLKYVTAVASAIRGAGFSIDSPKPIAAPEGWPPNWVRMLVVLGVLAGSLLALRWMIPLPEKWCWLLFSTAVVLGLVLGGARPTMITPLTGLLAGVVFPAWGTVWAIQGAKGAARQSSYLRSALARLAGAAGITLAGALLIIGLYSRPIDLAGIAPFAGVKLTLVLPLAIVLMATLLELPRTGELLPAWWVGVRTRGRQLLAQPVTIAFALVVLITIGALAFALSRSGNQPPMSPSLLELKFRSLLEAVLVTRPRTKEFLLGHPALMLAIYLAWRGKRTWLPLAALGAGLGQVSLLNTYCHFHTPLTVSLIRSVNGLWLGALIGLLLIMLWRRCWERQGPAST